MCMCDIEFTGYNCDEATGVTEKPGLCRCFIKYNDVHELLTKKRIHYLAKCKHFQNATIVTMLFNSRDKFIGIVDISGSGRSSLSWRASGMFSCSHLSEKEKKQTVRFSYLFLYQLLNT